MGTVILRSDHKAEPGKLYYCIRDEYQNILVCEALLKKGGTKLADRKKKTKIKKKKKIKKKMMNQMMIL